MLVGKEHIFKQRQMALCHSNFAKIDYFLQFSLKILLLEAPAEPEFFLLARNPSTVENS